MPSIPHALRIKIITMNTKLAVIVLFVSSIGWGLTWLPIKYLNELGLDSTHLILIAFSSGAIVLLPWLIKQFNCWKASLGLMLAIGLAGGIANASFQTAIAHGDVIRVMILFYMLPVWSVIGGRIFLQEKIDVMRITAVVLCLSGAALILDVMNASWSGLSWIDLLALASGLGLASTNILFRFTQHIPVMSKVAVMFVGCVFLMSVSLLAYPPVMELPSNQAVPYAMLYGALWLVLITTGTQWGVTQIEAGRSAIIIVMELVVAVASAAVLTTSNLGMLEIIGGMAVITAAVIEGSRSEEVEVVQA